MSDDTYGGGPERTSGLAVASLILGLLSFCLNVLAGIPALILGIVALVVIGASAGRLGGRGLAVGGLITGFLGSALWVGLVVLGVMYGIPKVRESAARMASSNNLMMIGMALQNYHDEHNALPEPYQRTKDGKPGLSWRVALLPYLGEDALYKEFHLDEPWDSEHNKKLLSRMPKIYAHPGTPGDGTQTYYQVFVGKGTAFDPETKVNFTSIPDGTSNTIAVVEAAKPVPWTAPEDLPFTPNGPLPQLGVLPSGALILLCDGGIKTLPPGTPPSTVRALITRNGNELVPPF